MSRTLPLAVALLTISSPVRADPLASLVWKSRPVVVFADDAEAPQFKAQMAALDGKDRRLADYGIKVVSVPHADPALRARLGVPAHGFALVLVGKDGDVKESWREPVDPARIFAAIDAMPMRRDEVRAKRDGRADRN